MAKNVRKTGHQFKAGNPGGPGRPPLPPEVKESRKFNQHEVEVLLSKFMQMNREQLSKVKLDAEATLLELTLHSIFTHAINKGDHQRLDFIMNRGIGKMKEHIEVTNPFMAKSMAELEVMVKEKMK